MKLLLPYVDVTAKAHHTAYGMVSLKSSAFMKVAKRVATTLPVLRFGKMDINVANHMETQLLACALVMHNLENIRTYAQGSQ